MLVVTELFNIVVNEMCRLDTKLFPRCSRVLVATELVISGTQCMYVLCDTSNIFLKNLAGDQVLKESTCAEEAGTNDVIMRDKTRDKLLEFVKHIIIKHRSIYFLSSSKK